MKWKEVRRFFGNRDADGGALVRVGLIVQAPLRRRAQALPAADWPYCPAQARQPTQPPLAAWC